MNIDDDIGLAQILGELLDIATQLLILFGERIAGRLGPALPRRQSLKSAGFLFFAPGRHQRRIQTMAAKQRADTAGAFGLLDLGQNALLELGGEMATLGLRHDFGIGAGGREGDGVGDCPFEEFDIGWGNFQNVPGGTAEEPDQVES